MKYEVVKADTILSLNSQVTARLSMGWQCQGGVAIVKLIDGTLFFFQALVSRQEI